MFLMNLLASAHLSPSPSPLPQASTLWAITSASQCAPSLPYGSSDDWDLEEPYVCMDCVNRSHDTWDQLFTFSNGGFRMRWKFSYSATLQERFDAASDIGEAVTWTIFLPDGKEHVVNGTWRWGSSSGGWPDLASWPYGFSLSDGCWAAGPDIDASNR
ncbi:hypothetical protein AB1Y20_019209 [Prymnesium parvum]|uniref:Uncharacterized protein n=1 Tax=Prymnesium parvum TaxID=97485 RepID=A0AB34JTN9_PRYPA